MQVSVVIPTLNRRHYLSEALASLVAQSSGNWEAVVVDDGSDPPVDREWMRSQLGEREFQLIRHPSTRGVAAAKNTGAAVSGGELITFLDDDDWLEDTAVAGILSIYRAHPELSCLFLGVRTHGAYAEGAGRNQAQALSRLVAEAGVREGPEVFFLGHRLPQALLKRVPIALQRPVVRRGVWNLLGGMYEDVIFSEPEWAIKLAMLDGVRLALTRRPLSVWRTDGQNFASRPEQRLRQMQRGIQARSRLRNELAMQLTTHKNMLAAARRDVADCYLDLVYAHRMAGKRKAAFSMLAQGMLRAPSIRYLRQLVALLLPEQLLAHWRRQ